MFKTILINGKNADFTGKNTDSHGKNTDSLGKSTHSRGRRNTGLLEKAGSKQHQLMENTQRKNTDSAGKNTYQHEKNTEFQGKNTDPLMKTQTYSEIYSKPDRKVQLLSLILSELCLDELENCLIVSKLTVHHDLVSKFVYIMHTLCKEGICHID